MDEIMTGIKKVKSIGILLKHHYGYNSKSIYGCDEILLKHLKNRGLNVELKPVLIHMSGVVPVLTTLTSIKVLRIAQYIA